MYDDLLTYVVLQYYNITGNDDILAGLLGRKGEFLFEELMERISSQLMHKMSLKLRSCIGYLNHRKPSFHIACHGP